MSSFSGLSAILSISLVALITVQMIKDKFEIVENYGENDDNGNNMNENYMQPYTTRDVSTAQNVREVAENLPVHNTNLNNIPDHGLAPFKTGDFFSQPYVGPDKNGWSGIAESYSMYLMDINNATPTEKQLELIGSQTPSLTGPNLWTNESFAQANVNTGRAGDLTLCNQNMNTFGVGNSNVASSLLPAPNDKGELEGFSDCNVTSTLADQVFLSASGQIGTMTVSSSRNSNLQLRSDPPCPILTVSPWMNSTIIPDLTRRPLEGCGPSFGLYGNGPNSSATPVSIKP